MVPFDILLTDLEGWIKVLEGRLDRVVQTNTAHRKQQVRTVDFHRDFDPFFRMKFT